MVAKSTLLRILDNSGARTAKCIHYMLKIQFLVLLFCSSLKKVLPNRKIKKSDIFTCLLLSCRKQHKRKTSFFLRSSFNAAVLIKKQERTLLGFSY